MKNYGFLIVLGVSVAQAQSRVLPPVIDNSLYPNNTQMAPNAPSSNVVYEVLGRMEQMQQELQMLRGTVEEQAQMIQDLQNRQNNIYADLDQRIQKLQSVALNAAGQNGLTDTSVSDPAQQQVVNYPVPDVGSSQTTSESHETASVMTPSDEKERYNTAYQLLMNGHNSKAIEAFNELIQQFPTGEYADNAQYWLGEAYKIINDNQAAKQAFLMVVQNYVNSPKIPDALYKLGLIEYEQKNMAAARDYFVRVKESYSDSGAAHLAGRKLQEMGGLLP
jgi:tol-pal system protein YbgF